MSPLWQLECVSDFEVLHDGESPLIILNVIYVEGALKNRTVIMAFMDCIRKELLDDGIVAVVERVMAFREERGRYASSMLITIDILTQLEAPANSISFF